MVFTLSVPLKCNYRSKSLKSIGKDRLQTPARISVVAGSGSRLHVHAGYATRPKLELTEESLIEALEDAREDLSQLFDPSVGITGVVELAELDGPFVKLRLSGKFWHKRDMVVLRIGTYLKERVNDIQEVEIEDPAQLNDSLLE